VRGEQGGRFGERRGWLPQNKRAFPGLQQTKGVGSVEVTEIHHVRKDRPRKQRTKREGYWDLTCSVMHSETATCSLGGSQG